MIEEISLFRLEVPWGEPDPLTQIDKCVVPTVTFEQLFVLQVLGHRRLQNKWSEDFKSVVVATNWTYRESACGPKLTVERKAL